MISMYEQVMMLPVFQGISRTQLTAILDKAHFAFRKLSAGDVIHDAGGPVDDVTFLLSGEVRVEQNFSGGKVRLSYHYCAPHTLPFFNLFGVETVHAYRTCATGEAGIMTLSKQDFLAVAQSHEILLVNILNILSRRVQSLAHHLDDISRMDETMRMACWILQHTDRVAYDISIRMDATEWMRILGLNEQTFHRALTKLERLHFVEPEGNRLKVVDRYTLQLFAHENLSQ